MRKRFRILLADDDDDFKGPAYEGWADHSGRPVEFIRITWNGSRRYVVKPIQPACLPHGPATVLPIQPRLDFYRELRDQTFARYEREGRCSPVQLRTIRALWIDGRSLRELARAEGVKPQAITARFIGLSTKAPEFWTWWSLKNSGRRVARAGTRM